MKFVSESYHFQDLSNELVRNGCIPQCNNRNVNTLSIKQETQNVNAQAKDKMLGLKKLSNFTC